VRRGGWGGGPRGVERARAAAWALHLDRQRIAPRLVVQDVPDVVPILPRLLAGRALSGRRRLDETRRSKG